MSKACVDCHLISNKSPCPACKSNDLSKDWSGTVIVVDAERSIIAEKMNIDAPGRYALKVRG